MVSLAIQRYKTCSKPSEHNIKVIHKIDEGDAVKELVLSYVDGALKEHAPHISHRIEKNIGQRRAKELTK